MKIYQVDAFSDEFFKGNPAAVCPLDKWMDDALMQKIAEENNLSETAFYVPEGNQFYIRWFTPEVEVPLCGHATLAAAHVLFFHEGYKQDTIEFKCKSGLLRVTKKGNFIEMDFPAAHVEKGEIPQTLIEAGISPQSYFVEKNYGIALFDSEEAVLSVKPDFAKLKLVKEDVVVITAKGKKVDFVSRVFGPKVGINEDPVTGSAHTRLIPFWAEKLGKNKMEAIQLSKRTGFLKCENKAERVLMSGEAKTYLVGEINL